MSERLRRFAARLGDVELFSVELLDEGSEGFSAAVPDLAIFTFGKSEQQALDRLSLHVWEKYQDLLSSPIPLNENEQRFLQLYRTRIIPALVEQSLRSTPRGDGFWRRLINSLQGADPWRSGFLENLKTSLRPSAG
ncbi:MAG: hypothetical protein HY784_16230 [Chloroflexi bacterium]|nr:hypothetical protein [Chloroflexota bacterium]